MESFKIRYYKFSFFLFFKIEYLKKHFPLNLESNCQFRLFLISRKLSILKIISHTELSLLCLTPMGFIKIMFQNRHNHIKFANHSLN